MEDEFDKLMKSFDSDTERTEKKLESIFQQSLEFFEKFKGVLEAGSEEEKAQVRSKMDALRSKLKEESAKSHQKLKLSAEEVKQISNDPKNFTPEQWQFLQRAQSQLNEEKVRYEAKIQAQKDYRKEELQSKKKKKPNTKRSSWMKS